MAQEKMTPLILASASPRRRELLNEAGVHLCNVVPADVCEDTLPGETPAQHVTRLACEKALAVAAQFPHALVLGADTEVVLGERVFGKPSSLEDAKGMLAALSGKAHEVLTGVCLACAANGYCDRWVSRTRVFFRPLAPSVIDDYCSRVNTLDKAGAYAIQEHGDMLVARIEGLRSNVIGLPVEEVRYRLAVHATRYI